jgi:hypothetical protein
MEHRNDELYVRVMTNTVDRAQTAGLTKRGFVGGSLGTWLTGESQMANGERAPNACPERHPSREGGLQLCRVRDGSLGTPKA